MIRSIILAISIFVSASLFGQINKGSRLVLLTGSGSYNKASSFGVESTKISLGAGKGWFVADRFCLGASIQGSFQHEVETYYYELSFTAPSIFKTQTYGLAPGAFARYYFPIGKSAIFTEVAMSAMYLRAQLKGSFSNSTNDYSGTIALGNIGIGYTYFLNENVGLELLPAYTFLQTKTKEIDFNRNQLSLSFGLQFYLNPKGN